MCLSTTTSYNGIRGKGEWKLKILQGSRGDILINYKRKVRYNSCKPNHVLILQIYLQSLYRQYYTRNMFLE
jgi:hypothetical protein